MRLTKWQRRLLEKRINRRAMDKSRPVKFHAGELVKFSAKGARRVYIVDHNSGEDLCHLSNRIYAYLLQVDESSLRRLTFFEFASFIHPTSEVWMSGKTRGYMMAIIHVFTFILCGATYAEGGGWWSLCPLVIVAGYWAGTWMNYKGYWK